jgi:putative transposase
MTLPIHLHAGDVWEFRGQKLIFQSELGDDFIHFLREQNGGPFQVEGPGGALSWPDAKWFLESFQSGALRKIAHLYKLPGRPKPPMLDDDHAALNALDRRARLRAFVLRGIDAAGDIPRSDKAITLALARLWSEQAEKAAEFGVKPSTRSVRRWLNGRGAPGERPLKDMVAKTGRGERQRRFPKVTQALMKRWAAWYWTRLGWAMIDAYAKFTKRLEYINGRRFRGGMLPLLKRPSYTTFCLEVHKLENFESFKHKHGAKKAAARFKACGTGLSASRFLRLGCMDHTVLDGMAVIDTSWMLPVGRPWLTILIDVRTRCVVGFVLSFEPPSIYSVMECIKRANRPKAQNTALSKEYPVLTRIFGRFDEIVVDNGKEFSGTSLEDAMADVGTTIRLAPVASPTYKAIVERFFRTLNQLLNTKLPGAVFKTDLLREMGYDPSKDAVLTIEQLESFIYEALATYHVGLHSGVGAPPAQLWQQDMNAYGIDVIGHDRALDKMMGAVMYPCRVTRSGVSMFGLQFHDENKVGGLLEDLAGMEPLRGQAKGSATVTVKVKYNPANLAEIHVWNRRRKVYVTLPCLDERYTKGMSLWHHRKVQEWAQLKGRQFNTEAQRLLARAQLIEQIEDSAPHLKGAARNAMRRLLNTPKVEQAGGGGVGIAYAPARHDGLAPVIPHELLSGKRTDDGQAPTRPARPKKSKTRMRRGSRKAEKTPPPPQPVQIADFDIDVTDWREIEL